jgi:DNA invertase Pin-like site-specific DNA recombinase
MPAPSASSGEVAQVAEKPERKVRFGYFPHTGNKPNEEKREIVRMLYNSGLPMRAVADRMGVSFQAVHSMLHRMGMTVRGHGGMTGSHSRKKK